MDHNPKSRIEQINDVMDFLHWIDDHHLKSKEPQTTMEKMIGQVGQCDYLGELHRLLYEEE